MIDNLSIAVHTFPMHKLTFFFCWWDIATKVYEFITDNNFFWFSGHEIPYNIKMNYQRQSGENKDDCDNSESKKLKCDFLFMVSKKNYKKNNSGKTIKYSIIQYFNFTCKNEWFGLVRFIGISTFVGYWMPNPLYTYILDIFDLVGLGLLAYQPL